MTDSLHLVFGFLFLAIVCCGFVATAMMEASSSRRREGAFAKTKTFSPPVFESERGDGEKEEKRAEHEGLPVVEASVSSLEPEMSVIDKPRRIVSTVRPGGKASQKEAEVATPKAATVDFIRAEELMEKGVGFSRILGRNLENVLIQRTEEGKQAVSDAVRKGVPEIRHARVSVPVTEESRRIGEASMRQRREREVAKARRFLRDWEAALREDQERTRTTEQALVAELRKLTDIGSFDPIRAEEFAQKTESGHRTNDPAAQRKLRNEMRGTTGGAGNNRRSQKKSSEKNKGEKNKKDGKWK